jgi:hypothetical protein
MPAPPREPNDSSLVSRPEDPLHLKTSTSRGRSLGEIFLPTAEAAVPHEPGGDWDFLAQPRAALTPTDQNRVCWGPGCGPLFNSHLRPFCPQPRRLCHMRLGVIEMSLRSRGRLLPQQTKIGSIGSPGAVHSLILICEFLFTAAASATRREEDKAIAVYQFGTKCLNCLLTCLLSYAYNEATLKTLLNPTGFSA